MKILIPAFILIIITSLSTTEGNASYFKNSKNTNFIQATDIKVEIEKIDASEAGKKDGQIKIMVTGGTAPYKIVCYVPDSEPIIINNNKAEIPAIPGQYLIVIQDKSNKYISREITISVRK